MEFTSSIPSRLLVRNGRAKAVLREAVRGIAPDAVLDNARKVGFNAPIEDLIDLESAEVRAEILADSPIYDIVRRDAISDMLENRDLRNSESKFLFSFLGSKIFLEEFE
jgi:asparagine synthase (glutamine-hydrolysing)